MTDIHVTVSGALTGYGRTVATDGWDVLVAVFYQTVAGFSQIFAVSSQDQGATWLTPVQISTGSHDNINPVVALDSSGDAYVAWVDSTAGKVVSVKGTFDWDPGDMIFAWGVPAVVSVSAATNIYVAYGATSVPALADGVVVITYSSNPISANLYYVYSDDLGATWSVEATLESGSGTLCDYPSIAGTDDYIFCAYQRNDQIYYRLFDTWGTYGPAMTWRPAELISGAPPPGYMARQPDSIIPTFWGQQLMVVFTEKSTASPNWQVRVMAGGAGGDPTEFFLPANSDEVLTVGAIDKQMVSIASSVETEEHTLWIENVGGILQVVHSTTVDGGVNWSAPAPVTVSIGDKSYPCMPYQFFPGSYYPATGYDFVYSTLIVPGPSAPTTHPWRIFPLRNSWWFP